MRNQRSDRPMSQVQKEGGGMRAPQRRDVSARQDLLGKELRQLFDDYTQEDMPDELMKLAAQLQGAFEGGAIPAAEPASSAKADGEDHPDAAARPKPR